MFWSIPNPSLTHSFKGREPQQGAVLFIAMIFLILLAMLAITASRTSIMQERMVGGVRNMQMADAGAESALREAEARLWKASITNTPIFSGVNGTSGAYAYVPSAPNPAVTAFRAGLAAPSNAASGYATYSTKDLTAVGGTANLASNPSYIIEDLGIDTAPLASTNSHIGGGYDGVANTGANGATTNHIYRITARSSGGNANTLRVIESTFSANVTSAASAE